MLSPDNKHIEIENFRGHDSAIGHQCACVAESSPQPPDVLSGCVCDARTNSSEATEKKPNQKRKCVFDSVPHNRNNNNKTNKLLDAAQRVK